MGRLIAILLGGAALAFFVPVFFQITKAVEFWQKLLPDPWFERMTTYGPGLFAGLALVLLAVRAPDRGTR